MAAMRLILDAARPEQKNAVAANFRVYLKPGVSGESRNAQMRICFDAIAAKRKNLFEVTACQLCAYSAWLHPCIASGR
jgi:hypothetical protein